jgi:hypothetical protein
MTKYYHPDPLGMGLVATLECERCGRDRYTEVTSTKDEDVIQLGEGIVELPHAACPCGETKIRTGWLSGDTSGDSCDLFDGALVASPQSPLTSQTKDGYWETPTAPLPEPLAHQFRQSVTGQHWEADFEKMTVGVLLTGELLMSEEPILHDLMCGPDGRLRMRPSEESRKIMVANIQERLTDPERPLDAAARQHELDKLAVLRRGEWTAIPAPFAESMQERYRTFVAAARPTVPKQPLT